MTPPFSPASPPIRSGPTPSGPSTRSRAHPTAAIWAAALSAALLIGLIGVSPAQASSGTISGTAFHDANRDGVAQADEDPFADHLIYLFDGDGASVANTRTDADGRYSFSDLPAGTYKVRYGRT